MRILLELGHPKHVHLFRPSLRRWRTRGDVVQILTRDKDLTQALLERYQLNYISLSKQQRGYKTALELIVRWVRCGAWIRRFRPQVALSVAGITTALPAKTLRVPNLALTDTETARLSNRIAFPFVDRVLTPQWFNGDFGARHFRYRSFHEWAYLHPSEFQPNVERVRAAGIDPYAPYALIRFVRWDAAHDRGEQGFARADALRLTQALSKKMRVLISAEGALPDELKPYAAKFSVEHIHHILAFATLVVGESPSMATEAALLGVPAILASSWAGRCGNMQMLEKEFGLMQVFESGAAAVDAACARDVRADANDAARTARRAALTRQLEIVPDVIDRHVRALTE